MVILRQLQVECLKFYASVRLDIRRSTQIKSAESEVPEIKQELKWSKIKLLHLFVQLSLILCMERYLKNWKIIDLGVNYEIIKKVAHGLATGTPKLVRVDSVKTLLEDNPELLEEIEKEIVDALKKINE